MRKMKCGCYLNNRAFRIGRKYATIYDVSDDKTLARVLLTGGLRERLQAVKDAYPAQDARRTAEVINAIFEAV